MYTSLKIHIDENVIANATVRIRILNCSRGKIYPKNNTRCKSAKEKQVRKVVT